MQHDIGKQFILFVLMVYDPVLSEYIGLFTQIKQWCRKEESP